MGILTGFLFVLFILVCLLLVFFVIIQDDQGEALGSLFGGGNQPAFGNSSGNILTKITGILGFLFFLSTALISFTITSRDKGGLIGIAREKAAKKTKIEWWDEAPSLREGKKLEKALEKSTQP